MGTVLAVVTVDNKQDNGVNKGIIGRSGCLATGH